MSVRRSYPDDSESRWRRAVALVGRALAAVGAVLRGICFWTAVVLPFLWVPLLAGDRLGGQESLALATLVALNVAALVLGHGHRPDRRGWRVERTGQSQNRRPTDR